MSTSQRSNLAEVRNPVLGLPAAQRLADLPPEAREAVCALLNELREDCRGRAEHAWAKHKGPMAAYWKATACYCGHISKAVKRLAKERSSASRSSHPS